MISIPNPEDYDVSTTNGFLPTEPPLETLSDPYYETWEHIVKNLQGLLLSKRLREVVDKLPVLSTDRLEGEAQWRRAYTALAFIAHAYIWGGKKPSERVPPPITIPFLQTCEHLQLPSVATYASVVLWNWKPIFGSERFDTLANLDIIDTFTGSLDEKWFYLISVAIEAKAGPLIPLMLGAMESVNRGDRASLITALRTFAERLDDIGATLLKMYDDCDPHIFYNRIRPFLAGSKNMCDAGLPNGVIFDNGGPMHKQRYVQYSGGSNAQSSIIQFFDLVLSVEHRPTGQKKPEMLKDDDPSRKPKTQAPKENFILEMRKYMPGAHARFLERVGKVANIRAFVQQHHFDRDLTLAFDACVAMLSALRDKHIQMVSRYIIVQKSQAQKADANAKKADVSGKDEKIPLAHRQKRSSSTLEEAKERQQKLVGTGGSSLIPFLRQARDETAEPASLWARRLLGKQGGKSNTSNSVEGQEQCQGLAGVWHVDDSAGGLCSY